MGSTLRGKAMPRPLILLGVTTIVLVASTARGLAAQQAVSDLYVQQDSLVLKVGRREALSVQASDDKGNAITAIKYSSRDPRIATVDANGTVTAVAPGRTRIVVAAGQKTKTVAISVTGPPPPALSGFTVQPGALSLLPGESARLTATGVGANGAVVTSGFRVSWKSRDPSVVAVTDSGGGVVGVGAGQGAVQVTLAGGPTIEVPVSVALAPLAFNAPAPVLTLGQAESLRVIVPGQGNRPLPPATLAWQSSDTTVVSVDAAGVMRGRAVGRAEITAAGFLQQLHLQVAVHPEIARFVLRPAPGEAVRLPASTTRAFEVQAEAADSSAIAGVDFTWTMGDTAIAGVDSTTGRVTGRKPGRTTLMVAARGYQPTGWTIEVFAAGIALDKSRLGLRPGSAKALVATFRDDRGASYGPATGVSWRSSDSTIAAVDSAGMVKGLRPGHAIVTAAGPGKSAAAEVFITGDLLVSISKGSGFGIYAATFDHLERHLPLVADSATSVQARYSPDLTRIVYCSDRGGAGNYDIWVADADGGNQRRLTTEPALDNAPAWTPDGRRIVFTSARSGRNQIYVMNADGTGVRALTTGSAASQEPAVSPSGAQLAYVAYREGTSGVVTAPLDSASEPAAPLARDRRESSPEYLANGELTFLVERKGGMGRYQVVRRPTGSDSLEALVSSERPISYFAIAADGAHLVYVVAPPGESDRSHGTSVLFYRGPGATTFTLVPLPAGETLASPAL